MSGGGTSTESVSGPTDAGAQSSWGTPAVNDGLWSGSAPNTQATYGYDVIDGQNVPWAPGDRRFTDNLPPQDSVVNYANAMTFDPAVDFGRMGRGLPVQRDDGNWYYPNGELAHSGGTPGPVPMPPVATQRYIDPNSGKHTGLATPTLGPDGQYRWPDGSIAQWGTSPVLPQNATAGTAVYKPLNSSAATGLQPTYVGGRNGGYWKMPDGTEVWGKYWDGKDWAAQDPRFADIEAKYGATRPQWVHNSEMSGWKMPDGSFVKAPYFEGKDWIVDPRYKDIEDMYGSQNVVINPFKQNASPPPRSSVGRMSGMPANLQRNPQMMNPYTMMQFNGRFKRQMTPLMRLLLDEYFNSPGVQDWMSQQSSYGDNIR